MERSQSSTDLDRDAPDAHAAAVNSSVGGPARFRRAASIAGAVILVAATFAGWRWFRWARSDGYQIQRILGEAPTLLGELEGMDSFDRWVAVMALAGEPRDARVRLLEIKNPYHQTPALGLLTSTLARAGLDDEAAETRRKLTERAHLLQQSASSLDDPAQQMEALKSIALALRGAGLTGPSLAVGRRAVAAARQIPFAEYRETCLSQLAVAFARGGAPELSREIFPEVTPPSRQQVALGQAVSALADAGQVDWAREIALLVAKSMLEARKSARPGEDRDRLDWHIGRTAIVLARIGLGDRACELVRSIADPKTRRSELCNLAPVLMERGFPTLARSMALELMAEAPKVEDPLERWGTSRTAAVVLVRSGSIEEAREAALAARATLSEIKSDPLNRYYRIKETVTSLARTGLDGPAAELLRTAGEAAKEIKEPRARSSAWISLLEAAAEIHADDQVDEAARSAEDAARRISTPIQQSEVLGRIVGALARYVPAKVDPARDVAMRIPDPHYRYSALSTILRSCIDAGSLGPARELARLAEKAAIEIRQPIGQSDGLASVVLALIRLDDLDGAMRIARMIGMPVQGSASLAATARALARKHRLREAREAAEACDRPSDRLEAFTTILGETVRRSQPQVGRLIDELEEPTRRPVP